MGDRAVATVGSLSFETLPSQTALGLPVRAPVGQLDAHTYLDLLSARCGSQLLNDEARLRTEPVEHRWRGLGRLYRVMDEPRSDGAPAKGDRGEKDGWLFVDE